MYIYIYICTVGFRVNVARSANESTVRIKMKCPKCQL